MPFNVPEDQKPEFNKKVKGSLELLTAGVTDKLRQIELESADTLVEAYNQPISEEELTQVPPSDMVTVDPQMARRIEINSLRMPDGTIYRNANELFSKPVDFNQFQAIGFVDKEGNATPNGELFFNLKEAGMFNEDGTLTKKGQAYSMSERDLLDDEANLDAFKIMWDDEVIRPSATLDEQLEAAAGFVGNAFGGFTDLMQTFGKAMSFKNAFDVLTGKPEGKKLEAEFQTSGLAAIEKITTNFANLGRLLDVGSAALADTIQAEDVAMVGPGGVPMYTQSVEALQQQNAEAERDLYAARQRQLKQNRDITNFGVGQVAETVLGLDGAVKMAEDAKNTLGAEEFNKRYSRVGAFSELAFDPTNLIPASVAFNVAKSVPIASRLTLGAQKVLGRVAQTEAELAKVQAVVQAGNAVLKKEELFVPRYQQLFKNMSAKAADNPELMVRANEVLDRAKQITTSADEVRAAMPTAMNTLEELTVKRNSLATRIPEAYANKVMQTVELGRRIRSAPARTLSSMLERTGNTLTKVDDAVTGYLKDRGLDQAYNAALGASGVVGLAGNPVVGAIGVTGAALKSGKFLTEYGKILRYVGKEMENARGQIPFWKRVAAHTAPGSLGRGIAHTFNIFELGGATSDIIRRAGRGVAAAYPTDLFFEWLSDGADMRPQTMTQAAAESLVIGGSFAAAGGAFMGTNKRMRELSIGDEINFRQGLTDTKQKALYEALPPGVRRSMATYSIANPTLNYNFIDSGTSGYDINTNTANINVNSSNPLKALVAHETLHHTLIKNNMEGGIAALFLGDTKTNAVGGLFRSKDGKLDPEFERFRDGYYKRLRDAGMTDAEIGVEFPLDKIAVEYFIDQHADQYATMAETGELGALAARGEVRKKLGSVLETVLPKIPVLRDLHIKSGGAIDANGAWVKGNGILGDDKIRQNPIANRMFREMNRRSSGMMPGQFEPLISDKEGSGAPLMFDPANAIDMELMHPFIQVDENDKPILKDGRPVFIDKSVDIDRAMAGLTAMEAMRKRRESNYAPEKGEAYIDDDGDLQPGWLSDAVLNEMFAKHKFNNEQKRMIRQYNRIVKDGKGQRMVMINFPATTRLKSGKVVYAPQKAAIRDSAPVAITISKDGNILYGLMSVTKLQENIKKRAQSKRGKKLYAGNIDAILQDVQAMMDFHLNRPTEDSIVYFNDKYGVVEGDQRKKFINTMFGLLNKKEQAVLNPMLLEDGVKSSDNVYRTYRADRVSKAVPMAPEEYAAMPFSYEAVSQVRMPEAQRAMPEDISPEDLNPVANAQEAQGLWADGKQMFAINEMDEKLIPITSKAMLESYPADAIGWVEPQTKKSVASRANQAQERQVNERQPTTIQTQPGGASVSGSEAAGAGLRQQGGLSGGTEQLQPQGRPGDQGIPLAGLPATVTVPGIGKYTFGPNETARSIAAEYARSAGIDYNPPRTYAKVDIERAKRIADEYEKMAHNPNDPKVKESYDAMIKETLDQWEAIKKTGLKVEPIPAGSPDPYAASPRLALIDVKDNNHLWFFPTASGFGGTESAGIDISGNPLMQPTGEVINGHQMLANDVFRIVHDYFGHIKEGVGFRADGEENAWRSHSAMYSDKARPAMTAETRGQNSWVNFGPFAEFNKAATGADTQYAPQKTGLLPDWVMTEGASDARLMPEMEVRESNAGIKEPVGSLGDLRKNVEIPKTQLPLDVLSVPKYVARETKDGDWKVMEGANRIARGNFQTPLPNAQVKKTKEFSTPKQDIISTASEARQVIISNKTSVDAKQQAADKVNSAIDKINNAVIDADNNPEKFVDVKGYAEIMKNAGVTGDILVPPSSLRTMLYKPDDFVALLDGGYHGDKTVAGIRDAAMSGLDAVVEMRELIGNQPPDLVTALHHLWGTLSKQLPPLQQEALWMRMIVNKDVMEQIGKSIDGTFNLSPDQWKQIVLNARASTKGTYGKLGENATSNANSFYLMLAKHNGKWNEVSNVYATDDAVDMRYKFNTLGHGATGIKNKVQSFIGLTFGIKGNVLDRWRFVDMFLDDAMKITGAKTPREYFKYEGKSKNVPVDKIGIYKNYGTIENGSPLFSLALYSAMDRVSQKAIDASPALQKILGNHADPGGLHWLSWNAIKNEAVGHSSLDITKNFIKKYKKGDNFDNLTVDNFVDFVNNTEAFVEGTSGAGDEITRLTLKNGVFNYSKR